jgi:hypothetical protein
MSYGSGSGLVRQEKRRTLEPGETNFDVLVTVGTNLRYQQNLSGRKIAIVVLRSSSNRLEHLRQSFPACVTAVENVKPGETVQVGDSAS